MKFSNVYKSTEDDTGGSTLRSDDIRIAVIGAAAVGKSALVVRYLTRRFIWDYDPTLENVYHHKTSVDGQPVSLQILDTAAATDDNAVDGQLFWADAVLLVYSVTDRASFDIVSSLCHRLRHTSSTRRHCRHCVGMCKPAQHSVVVVGNKCDLVSGRCVDSVEASARVDGSRVLETSAMEGGPEIANAFQTLCRLVIEARVDSHSTTLPGELATHCGSSVVTAARRRPVLRRHLVLLQAVEKLKRKLNRTALDSAV